MPVLYAFALLCFCLPAVFPLILFVCSLFFSTTAFPKLCLRGFVSCLRNITFLQLSAIPPISVSVSKYLKDGLDISALPISSFRFSFDMQELFYREDLFVVLKKESKKNPLSFTCHIKIFFKIFLIYLRRFQLLYMAYFLYILPLIILIVRCVIILSSSTHESSQCL